MSGPVKFLVIGCVSLIVLCVCCVVTLFIGGTALLGTGLNLVTNDVREVVCQLEDEDTDLEKFYEEETTDEFREATTFFDFESFVQAYRDNLSGCDASLRGMSLLSILQGTQIDYSNTNGMQSVALVFNLNENKVSVWMNNEVADGELKLHRIEIR